MCLILKVIFNAAPENQVCSAVRNTAELCGIEIERGTSLYTIVDNGAYEMIPTSNMYEFTLQYSTNVSLSTHKLADSCGHLWVGNVHHFIWHDPVGMPNIHSECGSVFCLRVNGTLWASMWVGVTWDPAEPQKWTWLCKYLYIDEIKDYQTTFALWPINRPINGGNDCLIDGSTQFICHKK